MKVHFPNYFKSLLKRNWLFFGNKSRNIVRYGQPTRIIVGHEVAHLLPGWGEMGDAGKKWILFCLRRDRLRSYYFFCYGCVCRLITASLTGRCKCRLQALCYSTTVTRSTFVRRRFSSGMAAVLIMTSPVFTNSAPFRIAMQSWMVSSVVEKRS
ncbi:MAG: hypothetical protein RL742_1910 [Bacteroidota bacterium]